MFDVKKVKNEVVEWIREYFAVNGNDCMAVIGISGGKDSSVVAALCCEALGKERVFGVLMPQGIQPDIDVSLKLTEYLGIKHTVINIDETFETLSRSIKNIWPDGNKQAWINIPPRIRMSVLYAVSACIRGRVANTCNLSEDYVGYATKFGDAAGDFSPLANLTVAEVKQIGRELSLPLEFVDKVPIDGLCGMTDEENLGFTYDVLDRYIREGICEDITVKNKIDKLNRANQHKLEPIPAYQPVFINDKG